MGKLKNAFLYSGVSKEEFERVKPNIIKANWVMVVVFSFLATVLIACMCIVSMFLDSAYQNRNVYIIGFFSALALFLLAFLCARKHNWLVMILVYISFSIFLLYGILIGTITNPTQQTVTFMVMLVLMPILFIDRPIREAIAVIVFVVIFIVLCLERKTGNVLSTDIVDALIYGTLGVVSGSIINHIKIRSYVLEQKLHDASRFDQLTQMNNRNSFESDLSIIAGKSRERLACIYIDVNGLHELNNTSGHLAGDIMLQFVAKQIVDAFGNEYTYRIGGDEFVAFACDMEESHLDLKLNRMNEIIEKESYHIAVGKCVVSKDELNMDMVLKSAEAMMYQNKSQYYKDINRDRRKR